MRFVLRALLLAPLMAFHLVIAAPVILFPTAANAAVNDFCFMPGGSLPGHEEETSPSDPTLICVAGAPSTFDVGDKCGTSELYYDGSGACVANNASCGAPDSGNIYKDGVCTAPPTPVTPTAPTTPVGFTPDTNASGAPNSELQPMCVNASPFIGGGMFVVSGSVLCYTGAGRNSNIYSYSSQGNGTTIFDRPAWDSLAMQNLYASGDVTSIGTLSVYGGAQIYSLNGQNGIQVNDSGVLIASVDGNNKSFISTTTTQIVSAVTNGSSTSGTTIKADGVNTSSTNGTSTSGTTVAANGVSASSTDGTSTSGTDVTADKVVITSNDGSSTSSLTVDGGKGISLTGEAVSSGSAVSVYGRIGATNGSAVGVVISGDGKGSATYSGSGPAHWADVLVASKSYDGSAGSAVIVNDYGVTIKSASTGDSYNSFGQAGATGSMVTNSIGTGEGGGATTNIIGNSNSQSAFIANAGSSSVTVVQGALDFGTSGGTSTLSGAAQQPSGGSSTIMAGSSGRRVVMDDNGRMTVVNGVADEASSSMHVTNGYGVTNGVMVDERTAALSGGTSNPTTLTLTDRGASFSNSYGAPVTVSGVADGQGPFDAANIRQLDGSVASIAALAGIPSPQWGKDNSIGIGMGHHGSGMAMAIGGQSLVGDTFTIKYGASVSYSGGLVDSSTMLGVGMSW